MRLFRLAMVWCLLALAGCASVNQQGDKLDRQQYAWSGAIRWGEVEGATNLIDPKLRDAKPISDVELERWKHIQVSAYRDIGSSRDLEGGSAARDIEIGVINRHTMAERTVRYRETWRWDTEAGVWWLTSGLPDLWAGQ
ncbi:hypothetical protein N800_06940 [Lysobacter daejeonensis GH1-9]|uniref:Lipoprotein n=1 Tax=Lysobacter daejeonensis GH1-9 TaxID=1385517 RepID=A0A0A0EQC9_9GAMM|nr:hypothetical protein [Lysobacter daejeonensis]KGM53201.1 hypothetical protein N800_06940 [Lysobacter daejeonensis GH1-9]